MEVPIVGSFEIIETLGSGPRGIVYRARHLTLGRVVAIKQLMATVSADSPEFSRLQNEVERLRAVASNDVLVPLSVDVVDGRPLIEMESLGDSLENGLRQGPLRLQEALGVLHNVLSGLETLHSAGIVHGNLKPSNVLQDSASGGWKVADGGMTPIESQTSPTLLATSVLYLAPESMSRAPDARSDLYSAGMIGLEAILGARMFEAFPGFTRSPSPSRWLAWLEDGTEARPLRELRPEIHDRISHFFSTLLSKQPDARPVSAEAALSELGEILPLAEAAPLQPSLGDSVTEIRPAYPTGTIAAIPQVLIKGPSGFERKIDLVDQRTYRIGRDPLNDIVLPDEAKSISRMHAELGCDQGRFVIKDLESQNGISVGGRRTPTAELTPGTTVKIGPYTLSLLVPGASTTVIAKPGPKTKTNTKTTPKAAAASAWWPPTGTAQWASYAAVAVLVLAVGTWAAWPSPPPPPAPPPVVEPLPPPPPPPPPPQPPTRQEQLDKAEQLLADKNFEDAKKIAEDLLAIDSSDGAAQEVKRKADAGIKAATQTTQNQVNRGRTGGGGAGPPPPTPAATTTVPPPQTGSGTVRSGGTHGLLSFSVNVQGAAISIDGVRQDSSDRVPVAAGSHRVMATKPGYRSATVDVVVQADTPQTVSLHLISIEELVVAARGKYEGGDFSAAVEAARPVLETDPQNGKANWIAGMAEYSLRLFTAATGHLKQAIAAGEEVSLKANHDHGLLRGSCAGTITLSRTTLAFSSATNRDHSFSTSPSRVLKLALSKDRVELDIGVQRAPGVKEERLTRNLVDSNAEVLKLLHGVIQQAAGK